MTFLFGPSPSHTPKVVTPTPIEKVLQSNISDETTRKQLAKMRKATVLSQNLGAPNIKVNQLGAGV